MTNYDVFNSSVKSQDQYEALQGHIYNNEAYTPDEISYYVKGLSFGFMGRVKVFFAKALAAIGLISGYERDTRIAAEVNRIGQTLVQQIGKDTGYYVGDKAKKSSLFDEGKKPDLPSEVPALGGKVRLLTSEQEGKFRLDSENIEYATLALRLALGEVTGG